MRRWSSSLWNKERRKYDDNASDVTNLLLLPLELGMLVGMVAGGTLRNFSSTLVVIILTLRLSALRN